MCKFVSYTIISEFCLLGNCNKHFKLSSTSGPVFAGPVTNNDDLVCT